MDEKEAVQLWFIQFGNDDVKYIYIGTKQRPVYCLSLLYKYHGRTICYRPIHGKCHPKFLVY